MEYIYTITTTSKSRFQHKLCMLTRIKEKSNNEIIHINKINQKWKLLKNFLKNSLNDDVVSVIKQYVNFKMNGPEIKWIIDNSYTTYPFECRGCSNFVKTKLNYKQSCLVYSISLTKDKYCKICKII